MLLRKNPLILQLEVVNVCRTLCYQQKEFVMSKQLLRSGTSIGANIRGAEHAESKSRFYP